MSHSFHEESKCVSVVLLLLYIYNKGKRKKKHLPVTGIRVKNNLLSVLFWGFFCCCCFKACSAAFQLSSTAQPFLFREKLPEHHQQKV